jgi:hypothetical protein
MVEEDGSKRMADRLRPIPRQIEMPTTREIQDRGKGDTVAKAITIIQTLWFAIQAAHRVSQGLIVTELELTTLAHVVLNIFIYWCWWNKPLNLQFPIDVDVYVKKCEKGREQSSNKQNTMEPGSQRSTSPRKLPIRVRMGAYFYLSVSDWGWKVVMVFTCFSIIGGMFGATHCLAWNSIFPTHVEHLLWRVSASVVTAFPGLGLVIYEVGHADAKGIWKGLLKAVAWFLAAIYCLGRLCLLALALAALRVLPEKAYEVPSWTAYIPHIG